MNWDELRWIEMNWDELRCSEWCWVNYEEDSWSINQMTIQKRSRAKELSTFFEGTTFRSLGRACPTFDSHRPNSFTWQSLWVSSTHSSYLCSYLSECGSITGLEQEWYFNLLFLLYLFIIYWFIYSVSHSLCFTCFLPNARLELVIPHRAGTGSQDYSPWSLFDVTTSLCSRETRRASSWCIRQASTRFREGVCKSKV